MAIAGLRNVLALDPSILRESRSSSIAQHGNQGAPSSSASSTLKMWRELEDEWLASRAHERVGGSSQHESNDGESSSVLGSHLPRVQDDESSGDLAGSQEKGTINNTVGESHQTSQVEHKIDHSSTSEHSQGFGEVERERVRQIFREWMNSGGNGLSSNGPNMSSSPRAQLLGQSELERVRVVREWIQMASQRRDSTGANGEGQQPGLGSQIKQVREGLALDHNQVQTKNRRGDIRKFCGRQALLELLEINKQELQKELQALSECGLVSCFPYRNRIQSLLRIRLLHNGRFIENSRPNSVAESELGFLRQRQTVSGLREGFLLKLHNKAHVANTLSRGSPNNTYGLGQNEVVDDERALVESAGECTGAGPSSDNGDNFLSSAEEINLQEFTIHEESSHEPDTVEVPRNSGSEDSDCKNHEEVIFEVSSGNGGGEQQLLEEIHQIFHFENYPGSEEHSIHDVSCHFPDDADTRESVTIESVRTRSAEDAKLVLSIESSSNENEETSGSPHDQHVDDGHEGNKLEELPHSIDLEDCQSEDLYLNDSTAQGEAWEVQVGDDEEDQPWSDGARILEPSNQWGEASDDELPSDTLANEGSERSHLDESFLHESGSQAEIPESWLPATSSPVTTSARRVDVGHFLDDDSAHGTELRELLSRRRVSSLLHSGFRDSLNQLIQSYVERQSHRTPDDWEIREILPPPFAIHDHGLVMENDDHDNDDDDLEFSDLDESPEVLQSIPMPLLPWEQQFPRSHWTTDTCRCPGLEVEMINDLRIEMARIHQRLNNMQRTLEACMDMQLELQRSVRQEVSAALNRSIRPSEAAENVVAKAGSKWDCVRRGICCICSESNIDSLLYRCGHMCACTSCAKLLVEGKGKCPMCQAPIVKVIRAYTIV